MRNAVFFNERHTYSNVCEFKVKLVLVVFLAAICVWSYERVGLHNLLDLAINEVVERVYVLLYQATNSQKCGH